MPQVLFLDHLQSAIFIDIESIRRNYSKTSLEKFKEVFVDL